MIGAICIQMSVQEMWRERFCICEAPEDDMPVSSTFDMAEKESSHPEVVQMNSTHTHVPKICKPEF